MQPIHFLPPDSLAPYIHFYGIIDTGEDHKEPYISPPLGLCGFILSLEGEVNARLNDNLFMLHEYCATGQITAPMVGEIIGKTKTLMVFIHPCGLYQLFGFNMSILTNTSLPLHDFLGSEKCDILIDQLTSSTDNEEMIQVMNAFFLSQLPALNINPNVKLAIDYIQEKEGRTTIKEIKQQCFITARSLERYFQLYIGLSQGEYSRILRFKSVINYIHANPGITWQSLSKQRGFYDQSHLSRYFDKYMAMKPREVVHVDLDFITFLLQD